MQTPFQEGMWNVSLLRISKREIEIEIDTTSSPGQREVRRRSHSSTIANRIEPHLNLHTDSGLAGSQVLETPVLYRGGEMHVLDQAIPHTLSAFYC